MAPLRGSPSLQVPSGTGDSPKGQRTKSASVSAKAWEQPEVTSPARRTALGPKARLPLPAQQFTRKKVNSQATSELRPDAEGGKGPGLGPGGAQRAGGGRGRAGPGAEGEGGAGPVSAASPPPQGREGGSGRRGRRAAARPPPRAAGGPEGGSGGGAAWRVSGQREGRAGPGQARPTGPGGRGGYPRPLPGSEGRLLAAGRPRAGGGREGGEPRGGERCRPRPLRAVRERGAGAGGRRGRRCCCSALTPSPRSLSGADRNLTRALLRGRAKLRTPGLHHRPACANGVSRPAGRSAAPRAARRCAPGSPRRPRWRCAALGVWGGSPAGGRPLNGAAPPSRGGFAPRGVAGVPAGPGERQPPRRGVRLRRGGEGREGGGPGGAVRAG